MMSMELIIVFIAFAVIGIALSKSKDVCEENVVTAAQNSCAWVIAIAVFLGLLIVFSLAVGGAALVSQ
jgi:hypothetical protein